jgi:SAM-dependent methyltransferase
VEEILVSYDVWGAAYEQAEHLEVTRSFHRAIKPILKHLDEGVILDLGCATGLLTERLASSSRRVLGVDRSPTMLQLARARCRRFGPKVHFELADLRDFDGVRAVAGAFACGDIVNHFQSAHQLGRFFRNVKLHLRAGGVFVFDALNRWCFEQYWLGRTYYFKSRKGDIVMDCDWDANREIGTASMTIYAPDGKGRYARRQMILRERLYENDLLRGLLLKAGFSKISCSSWSPWSDQHEEDSDDRTLWKAVC